MASKDSKGGSDDRGPIWYFRKCWADDDIDIISAIPQIKKGKADIYRCPSRLHGHNASFRSQQLASCEKT